MGYRIKLVELEFIVRTDVDIRPFIFSAVAVFWRRED